MMEKSHIHRLAVQIANSFSPERIILFGSHAYGVPTPYSDVDLLIVMPFEGSNSQQSLRIWSVTRPSFPVDFIVRRPDEVERRYEQWDPLIREALDKGEVIYERDGSRVDR